MPQKLFQEPGSRPSRALPYVLHAEAAPQNGSLILSFRNEGTAGAAFHCYDRNHLDRIPRRYTVEAHHSLKDRWEAGSYDLWILGPNGFVREFSGTAGMLTVDVTLAYHPLRRAIELTFANHGDRPESFALESGVYAPLTKRTIKVSAHGTASLQWDVSKSGNWYDLTLKSERGFARRFAGRLETGKNTVSDPASGAA
jgi:phospholipase C